MRPTATNIASVLTQKGYKLTAQRRAVIDVVANSLQHFTPNVLYERVRWTHPAIGLVTVYRTLEMLSELGLICRVHQGGKSRSYTLSPSGHHHHLVCRRCGMVADFTGCDLEVLQQKLSQDTGFKIEGHLLQFVGDCRNCQGVTSGLILTNIPGRNNKFGNEARVEAGGSKPASERGWQNRSREFILSQGRGLESITKEEKVNVKSENQ